MEEEIGVDSEIFLNQSAPPSRRLQISYCLSITPAFNNLIWRTHAHILCVLMTRLMLLQCDQLSQVCCCEAINLRRDAPLQIALFIFLSFQINSQGSTYFRENYAFRSSIAWCVSHHGRLGLGRLREANYAVSIRWKCTGLEHNAVYKNVCAWSCVCVCACAGSPVVCRDFLPSHLLTPQMLRTGNDFGSYSTRGVCEM